MKLLYKIQLTGTITLKTGLHIGGSETSLQIGGIDNPVIKVGDSGIPYIPGSSLKGKLRDLIARKLGYKDHNSDIKNVYVLFGGSAGDRKAQNPKGKLLVRDSYLISDFHLEDKAENSIDRVKGKTTPRHIERISRGAKFAIDMILDVYDKYNFKNKSNDKYEFEDKKIPVRDLLDMIKLGFKLLEYDYLGGSGTRGYGKVSITLDTPQKITFKKDGSIELTDFDINKNEEE